ncbi:hypothetical protein BOX15_Mlig019440g3, partial [Macrostomum lignano]
RRQVATTRIKAISMATAKRQRKSSNSEERKEVVTTYDLNDGRHFANEFSDFGISGLDLKFLERSSDDCWRLSDDFRARLQQALVHLLSRATPDLTAMPTTDRSVYTGKAGIAHLFWHLAGSGLLPDSEHLLSNALNIMKELYSQINCRRISFLCGDSGVLSLTAVLHWKHGDRDLACRSLERLLSLQTTAAADGPPNELLYGRSGYLFALAFVASELADLSEDARRDIRAAARLVALRTLADGAELWKQRIGRGDGLLFEWHDSVYFGAAHGLSGIVSVLARILPSLGLSEVELSNARRRLDVTVDFLRQRQFKSLNYPSSMGSDRDRLVHWCHGAPGFALMFLCIDDLPAALQCADVVWHRGLLHKGDGLCHGISGNGYVFLRLHSATGDPRHLHRAAAFAQFMLNFPGRTPDRPLSLFEGLAGKLCFLVDLLRAESRRTLFPAAELPSYFAF